LAFDNIGIFLFLFLLLFDDNTVSRTAVSNCAFSHLCILAQVMCLYAK
jgi:hypothetical protein